MTAADEDALLAAIDRIYESVERPSLWPETLRTIGSLIGGRLGFWGVDGDEGTTNGRFLRAGSHSFFLSRKDLRILDQYAEEFGEVVAQFLKILCLRSISPRRDDDEPEAIGLEIAHRYLNAFEPVNGTSLRVPSRPALRRLIAALWEDGCVFGEANLRCMRVLAPHLDRAARLQMRLGTIDLREAMMSGALDCLTHGVLLIDGAGHPLWHNRCAAEIFSRSNTLSLSAAGLVGRTATDTRSLRQLIAGAAAKGRQALMAVDRGDGLRPLLLIAVPLQPAGTANEAAAVGRAVVFMSDPDRADDPSVESLRQAFDLTNREAQMAIAIARGHGLQAAAGTLGVAPTTARTQLQQAFTKTGTRHQAELAALVHRTLTVVRRR